MTNYEWFKNASKDELAEFIAKCIDASEWLLLKDVYRKWLDEEFEVIE